MKFVRIIFLFLLPVTLFSIEISASKSVRLDITSRTSFGIDMDHPYRYGLANELTQVDLIFGLFPYQRLSNRDNASTAAVGFIDVTLFNLDLVKTRRSIGYNDPSTIGTNRYQTGEFIAGIVKGPWLIQLNALGNEPFTAPWNKGLQFVNNGFKLSWAYLDSMVDVRRVKSITGLPVITRRGEENMRGAGDIFPHGTMLQFGFDTMGNIADRFGTDIEAHMIAAMYNSDLFGVNIKFGTEKIFEDLTITREDRNGLIFGFDSVFTPGFLPGLRAFFSMMGTNSYGRDEDGGTPETKADPDHLFGGARVGYNIPLADDLSVEPWIGLDIGSLIKNGSVEKPGYEASVGLTMRWPGQGGWLKDYILNSDGRVFPGMSIGYKIFIDPEKDNGPEHSINFTLFEPRGNDGLFFNLGSEIIIDIVDFTGVTGKIKPGTKDPPAGFCVLLTAYFDWIFGNLGKMPGALVPWTIIYYDNLPEPEGSGRYNNLKFDLGLNLENAVKNTTFGIAWNSGSLLREIRSRDTGKRINNQLGYLRLMAEIRL